MAQVVLKMGHSLKGRDMLPVVQRLSSLSGEEWKERTEPWAQLSAKYTIESYTSQELEKEFRKLTSYDMKVILNMSHLDDCVETRRAAIHCAIVEANLSGQPAGDVPVPSSSGVSQPGANSGTSKQSTGPRVETASNSTSDNGEVKQDRKRMSQHKHTESEVRMCFKAMDADGSGGVSCTELAKLFKDHMNYSSEEAQQKAEECIQHLDKNRDDVISLDELVACLCKD